MNKKKLYEVPEITSIQDLVLRSCRVFGDKLAQEDLNNTPINKITFNTLLDKILKFGTALQELGIKERTHIALIGENRVQWAVSYLTCMCFNYVVVPIDKNLKENEILNIVHESDSEAIIFSDSFSDSFAQSHSALKRVNNYICMDKAYPEEGFHSMVDLINNAPSASVDDLPQVDPDAMAKIIFTSGSLGRAKGVMLSQKNLASNIMAMVSYEIIYSEDRFLSVLPMHHTYECTCSMLVTVYVGASLHYSRSLKTIVDDLQKVKATVLLGVPLLFDKMWKRISKAITEDKKKAFIVPKLVGLTNIANKIGFKDLKKKIFAEMHKKFGGHIRLFVAGGAAPDPLVAKGMREFGFTFIQGYGLTECSPILALNRSINFKDDAAGLPLPGVEIKIESPDNSGSGEILAKGPNVMLGYYKNEQQTNEAFANGWFRTGDVGFFDKDGFLHINGRMKNVIISKSGKNVYPEEIEDILNRSPYIMECVVHGEKDDKQDEIIAATLVVDAEAFIADAEMKEEQITDELIRKTIAKEIEIVNKQLASFKQIKKFHIREDEFEKTTTQKIKRYLVKK